LGCAKRTINIFAILLVLSIPLIPILWQHLIGPSYLLGQYAAGERDFWQPFSWRIIVNNANLADAGLRYGNLQAASLSSANLTDAFVTGAQLSVAASLEGATIPDATVRE
jgi:hypothetical protein